MPFLDGLWIGLGFIMFIGPVFFTLLQVSLNYGFWPGFATAIGILMSDILAIIICSFGAIPFFKNTDNQLVIAFVGALVLIALGLKFILKPNINTEADLKELHAGHYLEFVTKGFLINFVNPFVFVVWIGIIGFAESKYSETNSTVMLLSGALLGIIGTDTLKALFAHKISHLIKPKFLVKVYKGIGILLLVFAGRLVWYGLENMNW
ncbi:MAG: threonine/homoserine/homoserine lactone efflux protein [Flavobacteriales bacterium]|jgi:threonine/homoserine/homoserine lactone efflux protein